MLATYTGAKTLSITTFGIMTLSITILNITGIFETLSVNDTGHVTLSISTLSITVSSAVMLSVAMLNVIKLNVVMLIVVAPHPPRYILYNLPLLGLHSKGRLCPWLRKEQT
jgi:hypothetical protein